MKILVTGAAGFLGPHVVRALEGRGQDVVGFDLREPPVRSAFVCGDLTNLADCLAATQGVDAVCHLGGIGDVYLALEKPQLAAACNVLGTANLMEACHRNGVGKVVYASTWEVYGKPRYEPIDEEHPRCPDHPYNITKLAGEQIALSYDRLKHVSAVALRLGTAYGPGMRPNSVFSIFIQRAVRGEPIVIKGTGLQSRQFTHTSDIAAAFALAVEGEVHGEAFNVVAEESITIRQLAALVAKRFPTEVVYGEAREGDIIPARVSSAKARRVLGWEARTPFEAGLGEMLDQSLKAGVGA